MGHAASTIDHKQKYMASSYYTHTPSPLAKHYNPKCVSSYQCGQILSLKIYDLQCFSHILLLKIYNNFLKKNLRCCKVHVSDMQFLHGMNHSLRKIGPL